MKNSVCFILGGAADIGAAVARSTAKSGVKVDICHANCEAGGQIASNTGGMFIHCKSASEESVGQTVDRCAMELGVLTYAHLNSGVIAPPSDAQLTPFENASLEACRRVKSLNFDGVFCGLWHLMPPKRKARGGVAATASSAGVVVTRFHPIYVASTAVVLQIIRGVATAYASTALGINAICPGSVNIAMRSDMVRAWR